MDYEDIPNISKDEFMQKSSSATDEKLCLLLLGLDDSEDLEWILNIYANYLNHKDYWVASAAISGIGNLARKKRDLDKNMIIKLLNNITENRQELKSRVSDTIDDINNFC